MIRRPPRSTRTDTLFPYTTLFRSVRLSLQHTVAEVWCADRRDPGQLPLGDQRVASHGSAWRTPHEGGADGGRVDRGRSEEHTSELQSLMRISYAVFCLKKKKKYKSKIQ